jgi:hypothetical protein
MPSNSIAETGVVFFSAGGHSHNGQDSSLIDTKSYSIFDFNFGRLYTTRTREKTQQKNEDALKSYIINVVNSSVLDPAGIVLQDNIINSRNIISGSITSEEIAAGTITGNLIAANTILGNSIVSGSITADQIQAGTLVTDNLTLTNGDFWANTGAFRLGGASGITYSGSGTVNFGSGVAITGNIASSGTISGGTISGGIISGGFISGSNITTSVGSIAGWNLSTGVISSGGTALYSNGTIVCNILQSKLDVQGSIRLGANIGSGEELEFYRSNSNTVKNTLRTVGSNSNTFRISTIDGATFNFDTRFHTSFDIATTATLSASSLSATGTISGGSYTRVTSQVKGLSTVWNTCQVVAVSGSTSATDAPTGLSTGAGIAIRSGPNATSGTAELNAGTVQLRVGWNTTTLFVRNFNDSAAAAISVGALSKTSGTFRIDHPLDHLSKSHDLVHSFIEGPYADLIYRGEVLLENGCASVNLDEHSRMTQGTFEKLNRNITCFTSNETGWTPVKGYVEENILYIKSLDKDCNDKVSWLVIGERKDKDIYEVDWTDDDGRVQTEQSKLYIFNKK